MAGPGPHKRAAVVGAVRVLRKRIYTARQSKAAVIIMVIIMVIMVRWLPHDLEVLSALRS